MVKLSQIQQYMAEQSAADSQIRSIEVEGDSLEETLENGAVQLGMALENLEYEVLTRGDRGVLGVGKSPWVVRMYESLTMVAMHDLVDAGASVDQDGVSAGPVESKPGEVFVKLVQGNVFLKVTKPTGKAPKVADDVARSAILGRGITEFDASMVSRVVKRADGQFVSVGDFDYNPANDALMTVDITDGEMKALMEVRSPGPGGADLTFDNIVTVLSNNGVFNGVDEDTVRSFEDNPRYNETIVVAQGLPPANGADAKIIYNFNTEHSPMLKEKNGKVDFKELNLVENVVAGQILAKKVPAEEGEEGRTVTGKTLPAKAGRDCDFVVGKNVKLGDDGATALSEINGQVLLVGGRISVEPIYTVAGDVNLHTGNILFLGGVIVKGNVDDGFSVKAAGNIEVFGNVGKCLLDAEGDVVVHQGILGKNGGKVKAGKSIYAKFIEHAHVEAVHYVSASEGIIHSHVDANEKIVCQGKRASIVGGRLRAAEEINAKNLGSVAGTETILEVGYDPQSKERLVELEKLSEERRKGLEELQLNIDTLSNLKKVQKELPEEKEAYLAEQLEKRAAILADIEGYTAEIKETREHLASIKREGKISASDNVFAGCKIYIKDANLFIRNENRAVTFLLENGQIRVTKYEPLEEDFSKRV